GNEQIDCVEPILPYPSSLDSLVFTSPIHTSIDWIEVENVYPGATVEVFNGSTLVGSDRAGSSSDDEMPNKMRVTIHDDIQVGDQFIAEKNVQIPNAVLVSSQPAMILPATQLYLPEQAIPTPSIIGTINECDSTIMVSGAVPGCFLYLHTSSNE